MKYKTLFERRTVYLMALLMLLLFISALRILTVMSDSELSRVATKQTSYKLVAARLRGTVFDTNMHKLTNENERIVAAVLPTEQALSEVKPYLVNETASELGARLKDGKPVLAQVSEEINTQNVKSITVCINQTSDQLAPHLIGYTDNSTHGVGGIQSALDEQLYVDSEAGFLYTCDALGNVLPSYETEVLFDSSVYASGVRLTIDREIQSAVEFAAADMKSGAVVVSEVGTGKIRALCSFPTFDVTAVEDYLKSQDAPLINRAFSAYNVGSVFKLCVAAATLEQGKYGGMRYDCTGYKEINGMRFNCHAEQGHGLINLKTAISHSCNTFFYTLAAKVGAESIYSMASSLGFGQAYSFCDGLSTERGNLPSYIEVGKSEQSIANLAIGQGELMLTPVSLLPLYEAIANGGVYHRPALVEGIVKNGALIENEHENPPTRVMSEETAEELRLSLYEVISKGTGAAARPKTVSAAGKTATAQTGWLIDGRAVDHSWFCGFFPANEPRYTVVVLSENTSGGGTACAPIFSKIADALTALKSVDKE